MKAERKREKVAIFLFSVRFSSHVIEDKKSEMEDRERKGRRDKRRSVRQSESHSSSSLLCHTKHTQRHVTSGAYTQAMCLTAFVSVLATVALTALAPSERERVS